jgi:hypothetical protein
MTCRHSSLPSVATVFHLAPGAAEAPGVPQFIPNHAADVLAENRSARDGRINWHNLEHMTVSRKATFRIAPTTATLVQIRRGDGTTAVIVCNHVHSDQA